MSLYCKTASDETMMAFVLGALPASPAATRAWRRHGGLAARDGQGRHSYRRLEWRRSARAAVARVLIVSGFKELPAAWSGPFLWRTALMLVCRLLWASGTTSTPLRERAGHA